VQETRQRRASHRTIVLVVGALLFALTGLDFAVDRALNDKLIAVVSGGQSVATALADPRLVRFEWLRTGEQLLLFAALSGALALGIAWTRRTERLQVEWETSERQRHDIRRMASSLAHEVNGQLAVMQNTLSVLARQFPGHEVLRAGRCGCASSRCREAGRAF
jgi:hypothetical protein